MRTRTGAPGTSPPPGPRGRRARGGRERELAAPGTAARAARPWNVAPRAAPRTWLTDWLREAFRGRELCVLAVAHTPVSQGSAALHTRCPLTPHCITNGTLLLRVSRSLRWQQQLQPNGSHTYRSPVCPSGAFQPDQAVGRGRRRVLGRGGPEKGLSANAVQCCCL